MGTRKPKRPAVRPGVLVLEVSPDLAPWSPTPPPGGWTPATVWSAAAEFADDNASPTAWRRTVGNAARELFKALPTVKRAEIIDRLQGRDWRADTLGLSLAPDDDLDEIAPPF